MLDFSAYDLVELVVKFFMEIMSFEFTSFGFKMRFLGVFLKKPKVHLDILYYHGLREV